MSVQYDCRTWIQLVWNYVTCKHMSFASTSLHLLCVGRRGLWWGRQLWEAEVFGLCPLQFVASDGENACELHLTAGGGMSCPLLPLAACSRAPLALALVCAKPFPKPALLTSTAQRWPAEKKWLGPRDWMSSMKGPTNTRSGANPGGYKGVREEEEQSREETSHVPQGQRALRSAQKLVAPNQPSETQGQYIH